MAEIDSIGKYEIRREIGRGAMGVVYEGYDPSIKRVVALKTIRADQLTGGDPAAVIARFRREAQAAGRLVTRPHWPGSGVGRGRSSPHFLQVWVRVSMIQWWGGQSATWSARTGLSLAMASRS